MWFTVSKLDNRIVGTTDDAEKSTLHDLAWFTERYSFIDVDEYLKELNYTDEDDKILKVMRAAGLYNWIDKTPEGYNSEIEWGDWKHDHKFCDDLMRVLGYDLLQEELTEEDGSDCYSAIHYYVKGE